MKFIALLFLTFSFSYSLYEKVIDNKSYLSFLNEHFKTNGFSQSTIKRLFYFIVICNSICSFSLILSSIHQISPFYSPITKISLLITGINILILLVGQRIAKDFQGAANLGIYLLVVIFIWQMVI